VVVAARADAATCSGRHCAGTPAPDNQDTHASDQGTHAPEGVLQAHRAVSIGCQGCWHHMGI
jgi:hypothetical protein